MAATVEMHEAPAAQAPSRRGPSKFVMIHKGVGGWSRGDVISDEELQKAHCDIDRLLGLRAMRPATPVEYGQKHVDLDSPEAELSYQHLLADKDQQIARLTARIATLEDEKSTWGRREQQQMMPAIQQTAPVIEEKDKIIAALRAEVANFKAEKSGPAAQVETSMSAKAPQSPPAKGGK